MLNILFPECIIEGFEVHEDKLLLKARSFRKEARCPSCKQSSSKVHGYYQRYPHDLPIVSYALQFCLRVKRFCCSNNNCQRSTFAESFEPWLARYAHRSKRLAQQQSCVATVLSAKASEALLAKLRMAVSHDTALNLVRGQALPEVKTPRVLGVDDFAIRKRKTYGTILLDLEKHKVIEVLPDRTSQTLASWLKAHPGIEIISRDRSKDYRSAATQGAPKAIQVADRWHLLKNLSDQLKHWFERHKKQLLKAKSQSQTSNNQEPPCIKAQSSYEITLQAKLETRRKRHELFEQAKRLKAEGFSTRFIANKLGMGRSTLGRWFAQGGYPDKHRDQSLTPYCTYLKERYEAGISNKMQLYREITSQGFKGSYALVYQYFAEVEAGLDFHQVERKAQPAGKRITTFEATQLFTRQRDALSASDEEQLERIFSHLQTARACYDLVQRFCSLFDMQDQQAELTIRAFNSWLSDCMSSGIDELVRFAKGLGSDKAAIEAALTLPWSNGQTEGQVTKLKLIKRSMYGRANFDLLRRKVLLAA